MKLTVDRRLRVALDETSDVTFVAGAHAGEPSGGAFLVVSDTDARAVLVEENGCQHLLLEGVEPGESGLEAVTFDAAAGLLFSFVEEKRELLVHRWDGLARSGPKLERRLSLELGKKENKGVEGMVHLAAEVSPTGRSGLLLANEDKPRRLFFLADSSGEGSEDPVSIEMDREILEACDDFSGLAWDATRKSVLVVSDESASLVELRLHAEGDAIAATCVEVFALEDEAGDALERVEGVAVDAAGAWWVLLENDRVLCRLRR